MRPTVKQLYSPKDKTGPAGLRLRSRTCVGLDVAVVTHILLQSEPGQVEILGDLNRIIFFPLVL